MPFDNYNPPVRLGCLLEAPLEKALVPPNKAGTYPSVKNAREMMAPNVRHLVVGGAAERSKQVLRYEELPSIAEMELCGLRLLCPFDFELTTKGGRWLVSLDIPGLTDHETAVLLGLAAGVTDTPIVHVTDGDIREYIRTGRFPTACPLSHLTAPTPA